MLVNKFLTAKLGRENGKFVKHFPRVYRMYDVFTLIVHIIFH